MPNAARNACLVIALLGATEVNARVKTIQITRNESVFEGISFGRVGPYQKIAGRVQGEVDPPTRSIRSSSISTRPQRTRLASSRMTWTSTSSSPLT